MPKNTPNKSSKPHKPLYPPKNYKKWSKLKSRINNQASSHQTYREGQIYWFCLGENVGVEEDGKGDLYSRPALIVRGFSQSLIWIVPLSHTKRRGRYYHEIKTNPDVDTALLSQLKSLDSARISGKPLGEISEAELNVIKDKIKLLL